MMLQADRHGDAVSGAAGGICGPRVGLPARPIKRRGDWFGDRIRALMERACAQALRARQRFWRRGRAGNASGMANLSSALSLRACQIKFWVPSRWRRAALKVRSSTSTRPSPAFADVAWRHPVQRISDLLRNRQHRVVACVDGTLLRPAWRTRPPQHRAHPAETA